MHPHEMLTEAGHVWKRKHEEGTIGPSHLCKEIQREGTLTSGSVKGTTGA